MILQRLFYNIECDCCHCQLDEENWWDSKEENEIFLFGRGWKEFGDRHYCEDCWEYDDDDNIATADGRRYTEGGERLK